MGQLIFELGSGLKCCTCLVCYECAPMKAHCTEGHQHLTLGIANGVKTDHSKKSLGSAMTVFTITASYVVKTPTVKITHQITAESSRDCAFDRQPFDGDEHRNKSSTLQLNFS